ncbi:MAG: hypothetical protein HUU23_14340 [Caldilineales bacterium]|nr:hypothetical protein [Caldilineales bacterium]
MSHNQPFLGTQLQPRQGAPAGFLAGLGMALLYGLLAQLFGPGAERWLNTIAATLLGQTVIAAGWQPGPLLAGLGLHLLVAVLLGLLFAASLDRLPRGQTLTVATFYGFTIWFVSSFILGGWLNPAILEFNRTWWGLLAHLGFGLLLGLYAGARGAPPPTLSPD